MPCSTPGRPPVSDERPDVLALVLSMHDELVYAERALRAVTIDAAYSLGLEDEVGSLEPGKLANMTILEESPYEVDPMHIKDIRITGTVHEGDLFPVVNN